MDDLFSASTRERSFQNAPLAVRMRPNTLDEYVGQQKAVGKAHGCVPRLSTTCCRA